MGNNSIYSLTSACSRTHYSLRSQCAADGKYKCYYAHQIGVSQLAGSGAPVGCVVMNGKQYEPDSLEPLLKDLAEKHPELDIEKVTISFDSTTEFVKCIVLSS